MSREAHVRFWERVGVKFPCATRQHRLFCRITQNWRGRPLTDHATIIELIAATSTKTGLKVESALDTRIYKKGIRITKAEMRRLDIRGDAFHPEWNYSVVPRQPKS
jgi:hypothetical protein